nr:MAG TPA: hypothetical protein [Bacteriophage sp.]
MATRLPRKGSPFLVLLGDIYLANMVETMLIGHP